MSKEHPSGGPARKDFPYGELIPHDNGKALSLEFVKKFAAPYYLQVFKVGYKPEFVESLGKLKPEINQEVVLQLLGDRNWRTRVTGAYFAVLQEFAPLQDIIGVHMLRSELCCAGAGYCLALAIFNTKASIEYLNQYLIYYLQEPDLWFDQRYALEALLYTDKINGTSHYKQYLDTWHEFIQNKPYWKPELETDAIEEIIEEMNKIKKYSR